MKNPSRIFHIVALVSLVVALPAYAQNSGYQPRPARTHSSGAGRTLTGPSTATPASVVAAFLGERGVVVSAASLVRVGDPVAARNGITVVRLEQTVGGLTLYGVYARASLTSRGELVHLIENLVPQAPGSVAAPRINEAQALSAVLGQLYPGERINAAPVRREGQAVVFERTPFFHDSPTVTRVAFVAADGSIRAGLLVDTWSERENLLHHTLVGPDGAVLSVERRTSFDAYNVFTEDPGKTPQQVVPGPGAGNAESPGGMAVRRIAEQHRYRGKQRRSVPRRRRRQPPGRGRSRGDERRVPDAGQPCGAADDPAELRGGGAEPVLLEQRAA